MTGFGLEEMNSSSGTRLASAGSVRDFFPPISSPSRSLLLGIGGATGGFGFTNGGGGIRGIPPGGGGGGIPRDKQVKNLGFSMLFVLQGRLSLTNKKKKRVGWVT